MTTFELEPSPMVVVGPFVVNYNSPNVLTTGTELFTAESGYVICNIWFEYVVAFDGSGGWTRSDIVLRTANDIIYPADGGYWDVETGDIDNGTDVARLGHADLLGSYFAWSGPTGTRWFPARMKATTPILFKLVPFAVASPGGTMTAGQLKLYALVGELP